MDLVNSVTQNSNNRKTTMENEGGGEDDSKNKNNDNNSHSADSGQSNAQHLLELEKQASKGYQVPDYLRVIGMDPRKYWPKKYRFTREKSPGMHQPMTVPQRNFYENNGYIVLDDCAPKKLIDSIKTQYKSESFVSEFLLEKLVAKNGSMIRYAKCFCDERLMLMTHRLIEKFQTHKHAKEVIDKLQVSQQQLFRDWIFLPFRPIDKVVCAVTAIDTLDHVILVVPGTHKVGQVTISSTLDNISAAYDSSQEKTPQLREMYECSPERLSTVVDQSKKGFKYVNLNPGQTLFYHPGLVHGFSNDLVNFGKSQLASVAYYAAADCEYVDLRNSLDTMPVRSAVPIGLAHFQDKHPSDYTSWIDKPRLLRDHKPSL